MAEKEATITIEEVRELAQAARDGWEDIYREAESDLEFYDAKNQWSREDYTARLKAGRHAITINRLPQFVHQVENEIRQNTPTIKVLPADSFADPETAEVQQDLIRNIEYVSQADVAYDTAASNAVKASIGFIRVDHDYTAPDTFEQHILIKRVPNALACIIDPSSIEADGSDAQYGFAFDTLSEKEFKRKYPDAKPESFDTSYISREAPAFSCQDGYVTLAEMFKIKTEKKTIYQLETGEVVLQESYEKLADQPQIMAQREIEKRQCYRYLVSGAEILEEGIFPSSYIPIVPVYGEEHWIDGKRHLYSLIRNAKPVQRMYNYWKSLETELLQKAPKAQYLAAEGAVAGYEDLYRNPDLANLLVYKQVDVNGQPSTPPIRIDPPPIPAGVINASLGAVEDMKATMGIYDASLGNKSNEQSGKAIIARQRESDVATYHFADNLSRSITHVGRIILDMIPRIYDTPRILRVLGEDGEPRNVGIAPDGQPLPNAQNFDKIYDLSVGKYDVVVTTGPSYATKRVEAAESMLALTQANPQIMQGAADLLVESLDIPNADVIAKRLKKIISSQSPGLIEEEEDEEVPDLRPQVQQMEQLIEQAAQQIEALQGQLAQAEQEKQNDQMKAQVDAAKVKLDYAKLQLEAEKLRIEEMKIVAGAAQSMQPDQPPQEEGSQENGVLAGALSELAQALAMIGESNVMVAAEISRPKRIIGGRNEQGQLVAEVVQ
jgi:hypothetical protein